MSWKSTLVIAVIFGVLLGFYTWDKGKRETKTKQEEEAAKVLPFESKDADQLVLKVKGDEQIELTKVGGTDDDPQWEIVKPVKTKADNMQVRLLMNSLNGAKKQEPFDLAKDQKLADFGLEDPAIKVEVKSGATKKFETVALGDRKSGIGDYYANTEGQKDKVFVISSAVQYAVNKKLMDLRDKTLLTFKPDEVTSVTLSMDMAGEMKADKRDGKWQLGDPVNDAGDEQAIGDLLRKVDSARAADFVNTTDTLQLANYGLENPKVKLTVWAKDMKAPGTLLVGDKQPEEERYYAMAEGRNEIMLVPQDVYEQLTKAPDTYRSRGVFPNVGAEADQVDVSIENATYSLAKNEEGKWAFGGDSQDKVDSTAVDDLVAALADLRVKEFISQDAATTDTAKYGIENPTMTVTLQSKAKQKADKVVIGSMDENEKVIYAKREGNPSILALEWKDPEQFQKKREDLIERKIAAFKTEDAATIEVQSAEGGESKKYVFEKKENEWQGKVGEGDAKPVPELEASSFLNALTALNYSKQYPADSQELEAKLAPTDAETTMTLKAADGKTLLDLGVSGVNMNERFLRQPDGSAYSVEDSKYQTVGDALKALLNAAPKEEEE